jgi:hypothetical protein
MSNLLLAEVELSIPEADINGIVLSLVVRIVPFYSEFSAKLQ